MRVLFCMLGILSVSTPCSAGSCDDTGGDSWIHALSQSVLLNRGTSAGTAAERDLAEAARCASAVPALVPRVAALYFEWGISDADRKIPERMEAHLRAFIQRWGRTADAELKTRAESELGALLWSRSCPVRLLEGSCVEHVPLTRSERRQYDLGCIGAPSERLVVHRRDKHLAAEARLHLERAVSSSFTTLPEAEEARARAQFLLLERAFEKRLATNQRVWSRRNPAWNDAIHFVTSHGRAWREAGDPSSQLLQDDLYAPMANTRSVLWLAATHARIAQLSLAFSDAWVRAQPPIPEPPRDRESRRWYGPCCLGGSTVDVYENIATDALAACARSAKDTGPNPWSALCGAALNQLTPNEFPLDLEVAPRPGYEAPWKPMSTGARL